MSLDGFRPLAQEKRETLAPVVVERFPTDFRNKMGKYMSNLDEKHHSFSFTSIFQSPSEWANGARADKVRGESRPEQELSLPFARAFMRIEENGFDGSPDDVLLRWVGTKDEQELEGIVQASETNGGMISSDAGLNMSTREGRVDKAFRFGIRGGEVGVIFMYDGRKMVNLEGEEKESSSNFAGGYGYKPKEGESYRSALLGTIIIP